MRGWTLRQVAAGAAGSGEILVDDLAVADGAEAREVAAMDNRDGEAAQLCRCQALRSVPSGPASSGLPKPMKGRVARLALANWRSALRLATEGSTVKGLRCISQAASA